MTTADSGGEPVPDHGPWRACRADSWCTRGPVDVTGPDIVRIARTLAVEPWQFTATAPAAVDDPAGIRLSAGRRRVTLTLANTAHGCVFLLRAAGGTGVCGLGKVAPAACTVHPADPAAGVPAVVREPGGCDNAAGHLDGRELDEAVLGWTGDRARWHEIVARWNAIPVAETGAATIEDFQRYLLEVVPVEVPA
jgi:hypothetical protein